MKRILRSFLIEGSTLWLVSQISSGLVFQGGIYGILITAIALTIATFLIKPIVNILLLPLNLMTFGLFKWVSQAITLFLVDLVLPEFLVDYFSFGGYRGELVVIPSLNFDGAFAYIAFSFLISLITSIIYWLVD